MARWDVGAESHEPLAVELREGDRLFPLEGMPGGHHENQSLLPAGHGAQSWAGLRVGHEPQIGAPVLDGIVNLFGLAVIHRDLDAGVCFAELLEQGREVVQSDADDAGDTEFSTKFAAG